MSKGKTLRIKLPPAIGAYVALFEPRDPPPGSPPDKKPRYGLVLLYDKATAATVLAPVLAAIKEVATARWGTDAMKVLKGMKYPVIGDGDERYPDDPTFKGKVFIRATSERKVDVLDRNKEEVFDDSEAYSGCTFISAVALYPFDKAGSKGVGVGLNAVMVVKKGQRMDGRKSGKEEFADTPAVAGGEDAVSDAEDLL